MSFEVSQVTGHALDWDLSVCHQIQVGPQVHTASSPVVPRSVSIGREYPEEQPYLTPPYMTLLHGAWAWG
jgi:hypothetical protein